MGLVPVLLAAAAGYLLGAIPFGVIIGRLRGIDPRTGGSGRTGATNALRTLGTGAAAVVLVLDLGKGAVAVLSGRALSDLLGGDADWVGAVAGVAAVIGHVRSVFIGFGGGRGVATSAGVIALMAPLALLASVSVFAFAVWRTRFVSLGSILAAVTAPLAVALLLPGGWTTPAALASSASAAAIVIAAHTDNIARLRTGTERRLGDDRVAVTDG